MFLEWSALLKRRWKNVTVKEHYQGSNPQLSQPAWWQDRSGCHWRYLAWLMHRRLADVQPPQLGTLDRPPPYHHCRASPFCRCMTDGRQFRQWLEQMHQYQHQTERGFQAELHRRDIRQTHAGQTPSQATASISHCHPKNIEIKI